MKARGRSEEPGGVAAAAAALPTSARPRRDSSASSLGSGVRCACQFYQSDSLLPERDALRVASRPPSRAGVAAAAASPQRSPAATMDRAPRPASGEHLYEPVSPPPEVIKMVDESPKSAVAAEMSDVDMADDLADEEMLKGVTELARGSGSADSKERRYLRTPLDDSVAAVPDDGDDEDVAMAGAQLGDSLNGHADEEQEQERRYMATPTPTTTSASRTDCDINTSMLDSSGLEDLPLKRGARKRIAAEPEGTQLGFQQRVRAQAGRLRSKLRGMSRPRFSLPERPRFNMPERPKFHLPDRPKFNLPDRPRFSLPDRPKFSMPERPKFSMPERPKFSMPERPKFHLPEKPKFQLPQRPKFSMPGSAKTPEEKEKKKKPTSSIRRPLRDRASTVSTASSTAGHKRLFDFDFRSYPRIFDRAKRSRDYATSSPKVGPRKLTPPPQQVRVPPARKKVPVGQRWLHRFTDIKFADDELGDDEEEGGPPGERRRELGPAPSHSDDDDPRTESTAPFHDKDFGYAISLERSGQPPDDPARYDRGEEPASVGDSDREQRSSGSSSERRRAGVLEEIDSDEFFLREKGISQEDVAVGRYLTSEIRDAFRRPASALARMDSESPPRSRATPERPLRPRSLRRRRPPSPPPPDFGTFPPARPKRHRRAQLLQQQEDQRQQQEEEVDQQQEQQQKEEEAQELEEVDEVRQEDSEVPTRENEEPSMVEEMVAPPPPTLTLTGPQESVESQQSQDERQWGLEVEEEEQPLPQPEPPQPPKRKRRSRRDLSDIPPAPADGGPRYANDDFAAEEVAPARYANEDFAVPFRYSNENFAREVPSRYSGEDMSASATERYSNGHFVERLTSRHRYDSEDGPAMRRYIHEDVSHFHADEELTFPTEDSKEADGRYVNGDALIDDYRRHSVDAKMPVVNGHYTKEDWLESVQSSRQEAAVALEPDYIIPGEGESLQPPVAPRRLRRRAGGSSRGTSLADEDGTSRAAESLPSEPEPEAELEPGTELEPELEQEAEPGYAAVVAKPRVPSRRAKPRAPRRRSLPTSPRFFSLPRRAIRAAPPVRPVRNYSTLGPSRPPRRTRLQQQQQQQQYVEIDEAATKSPDVDAEEAADGGAVLPSSALQAGDVVERMKGRPLPPPPRPPRKQRDAREGSQEVEESAVLPVSMTEAARLEAETEEPLVAALREDTAELEDMPELEASVAEEASVATQTDPLPDDVCVEPASDEPPPTFADAFTETEGKEVPPASTQEEAEIEDLEELEPEKDMLSEESARLKAEEETLRKATDAMAVDQESKKVPPITTEEPVAPAPPPRRPPAPEPVIIEKPVPFYVMPDADTEVELKARRLEVSELDVGRLTVGELQARKMVVSDVDSVSLQAAEFSSKTTNLAVSTLELPSGLLQELRESLLPQQPIQPESEEPPRTTHVETAESHHTPALESHHMPAPEYRQTVQPPPPTTIPASAGRPRPREYESEEEEELVPPVPVPPSGVSRRRRHIPRPQLRHSSSDEEELDLPISRPVSRGRSRVTSSVVGSEASAAELCRQLITACQTAAARALHHSVQYACSVANIDSEQHRRELQVILCGLLVAVAALVLFGFGSGKTFHYHHWDYVFPPP